MSLSNFRALILDSQAVINTCEVLLLPTFPIAIFATCMSSGVDKFLFSRLCTAYVSDMVFMMDFMDCSWVSSERKNSP
jgi:hypothetical protein